MKESEAMSRDRNDFIGLDVGPLGVGGKFHERSNGTAMVTRSNEGPNVLSDTRIGAHGYVTVENPMKAVRH